MRFANGIFNRLCPRRPGHVSYSQCGEDRIVDFLFTCVNVSVGTYLDIGAHHPTDINNTYFFYKKGWRGFNIDPLAAHIELFNAHRSHDVNIAAGIGDVTGVRPFYRMSAPTLSTFQKENAENYCRMGHSIEQVLPVQFLSAVDLIKQYDIPANIDLLSLDTEGGELEIIENLVKGGVRPKVMICETVDYVPDLRDSRKNSDLIEKIKGLGFMVYADTFINTIFLDQAWWRKGSADRGMG